MSTTMDLGLVTAYGYAVEGGYTGTEAEFKTLLGQQQTYHDEAVQAAEDAEAYAAQAMSGTPDGYASLVSTVNSLNSAFFAEVSGNITTSNIDSFTTPGIYSAYIEAASILGISGGNTFGLLMVSNPSAATRVGQYIFMPKSGVLAARYNSGSSWSSWNVNDPSAVSALTSALTVTTRDYTCSVDGINGTVNVAKYGRICIASGTFSGTFTNVTSGTVFATITDAGYKPLVSTYTSLLGRDVGGWASASYYPVTAVTNTSGNVTINGSTANIQAIGYLPFVIVYISAS